ncbi:MAG TPA: hypothetical protein VLD57_00090, partial [Blastocatellia bacterium]|nr:hypothetical protein [Blastocatellia bacterium]
MTKRAEEAGDGLSIKSVVTPQEQSDFLELPYMLHRGLEHWVPPLRIAQKEILDTRRHPVYKSMDVEKFISYRYGKPAGRVMAIINHTHNEFHKEKAGFFGFFETINDAGVASLLLDAARDWTFERGADLIRGPVSPSTNYECGLLVDGFDRDPAIQMPYNPPYYASLIEGCGFSKAMDLYAYELDVEYFKSRDKIRRVAERLKSRDGIRVRAVDLKQFKSEVAIVRS